jgi:hypothetical protein
VSHGWFQPKGLVSAKVPSSLPKLGVLVVLVIPTYPLPHLTPVLLSFKFSRHRKLLIFEPCSIALFLPLQGHKKGLLPSMIFRKEKEIIAFIKLRNKLSFFLKKIL